MLSVYTLQLYSGSRGPGPYSSSVGLWDCGFLSVNSPELFFNLFFYISILGLGLGLDPKNNSDELTDLATWWNGNFRWWNARHSLAEFNHGGQALGRKGFGEAVPSQPAVEATYPLGSRSKNLLLLKSGLEVGENKYRYAPFQGRFPHSHDAPSPFLLHPVPFSPPFPFPSLQFR